MSIAIVGGGLAAVTAAVELREHGYEGPVTVYTAEQHLPYERPPLSKGYLLGKEAIEKVFPKDAHWYRDNNVEVRQGEEVTALDLANHVLRTSSGEHSFSQLLLATGATPRTLPLADQSGKPVFYLRTIEDSTRLREALTSQARVVIVGAGWIGLEVAAAAREAGAQVTVYETEELPLVRILGSKIAQVFADLHRAHGVDLRLSAAVTAADFAEADLIVVGIGAVPQTALAQSAGLAVDNGILVDAQLRTSHPDVYAVGDVANHDHPAFGQRIRVEHWDNAIGQAKTAAHNLLGGQETYEQQPYFFTDQYDLGMEYVGNVGPKGFDDVQVEGDLAGAFRAFWLRDGVVVAAMQANDWDASDVIRAAIGTSR